MPKRADGKDFERIVRSVYDSLCEDERFTSVESNVKLAGPDGPRQIDVLVTHVHAGSKYVTVIECRDHAGKLDVSHVDAFSSTITDVNASKGILISRKGFSKTAVQKAKRLGIGLATVDTAHSVLKSMALELSLVVAVVDPKVRTKVLMRTQERSAKVSLAAMATINDTPLRDLVIADIHRGRISLPDATEVVPWHPAELCAPYYVRDMDGEPVGVESFTVELTLEVTYCAGTSNDLPDFVAHSQVGDGRMTIFIPAEYRVDISNFARYSSLREVPSAYAEAPLSIMTPDALGGKWESSPKAYKVEQ